MIRLFEYFSVVLTYDKKVLNTTLFIYIIVIEYIGIS